MIPIPSADTIKLILATIAIVAFFGWGLHERLLGETIQANADKEVAQAQVIHDQEVIAKAQQLVAPAISAMHAQLAAPPAADAPHLRVCLPSRPANVSPVPDRSDAVAVPEESTVVQGPDLGPAIDKRFADDDARWAAAQATFQACIASGRCGVIDRAKR